MKWDLRIIKLPSSKGHEQEGLRPCIVLKEFAMGSIIIPMTSNLDALRFPYAIEIEKSKMNGLLVNSIAMIFQIRYVDKRRFVNSLFINVV